MIKNLRWMMSLIFLVGAMSIPSAFADAPNGMGPDDALMVPDTWQVLEPNTSLWFYFDVYASRSRVQALLDTKGTQNVQLAIYTPDQARAWQQDWSTKPVGLGTSPSASSELAGHDLVWTGAFNMVGRFFAVVTNQNTDRIDFRLQISGSDVALRPTPTRTPKVTYANPYATPIPIGSIEGRLLFQESSGGLIYTVKGDGSSLRNISYGIDPSWSPDGKQIAFARINNPAGLFIANADGSAERIVFSWPQVVSPQWSPDGRRIAFVRQPSVPEWGLWCPIWWYCFKVPNRVPWKIGVVELDKVVGDTTRNVLAEPPSAFNCAAPTWSPDNHTLVYTDDANGVMTTDTLTKSESRLLQRPARIQSSKWSPDGTKIAFQVLQHDHWEINVMNADGSNAHAVTRADFLDFQLVNNVAPAWSPDSKQILFLSDRGGKWEFFVADVEGTNLRQVLKNVSDTVRIQYSYFNERVIDWTR